MKFLIPILMLAGTSVLGSQVPGTQLTVDVTVKSLTVQGDTMTVTYTVFNRATSRDSLFTFTVDAPARVKSITTPTPVTSYDADSIYRGQPVADWAFLDLLVPGLTSVPLTFRSVGLPAVEKDWAGGNRPVTEETPADTVSRDPLKYQTVAGNTVGVEPWPVDRTAKALIARLRALTQKTCAAPLTWITSSTLCTKLIGYLDQAETNRAAGRTTQAKSAMNSYISSLSGKTAGTFAAGVTNPGYWVLKPNADIVVSKL
jgi:hypothetical protein